MADKRTRPASAETESEPRLHTQPGAGSFSDSDTDELNDLLEETNGIVNEAVLGDEVGDPDIGVLSQQEDEDLEDDLLDVKNPHIASEPSEDSVRLYLREIGEVKLLDSDSEFRLATLIEADRWVGVLQRRPLRKGFWESSTR